MNTMPNAPVYPQPLVAEIDRLRAVNAELVAVLRYVLFHVGQHRACDFQQPLPLTWPDAVQKARTALAKAAA